MKVNNPESSYNNVAIEAVIEYHSKEIQHLSKKIIRCRKRIKTPGQDEQTIRNLKLEIGIFREKIQSHMAYIKRYEEERDE